MTTVYNLSTGDEWGYTLTPEAAVIAAYAQSRGDWTTWEYAKNYHHLLVHGKLTVSIGDFCAFKERSSG